jgi:hypothetical protein
VTCAVLVSEISAVFRVVIMGMDAVCSTQTRLYGVISRKILIFIFAAVRT